MRKNKKKYKISKKCMARECCDFSKIIKNPVFLAPKKRSFDLDKITIPKKKHASIPLGASVVVIRSPGINSVEKIRNNLGISMDEYNNAVVLAKKIIGDKPPMLKVSKEKKHQRCNYEKS